MVGDMKRPGLGAGPSELSLAGDKADDSAAAKQAQRGNFSFEALLHEPAGIRSVLVKGRTAWALMQLMQAGPSGCTPITNPAPRWSAYVFNLRQEGIQVETIHEPHSGPFSGHHARYVLRSVVTLKPAFRVA